MVPEKTEKEIAYLHDLFVAPDWDERFAILIDQLVKLPKEGAAAYVACGTGGHALALKQRGGTKLSLSAVDENAENVELAKAKAVAAKEPVEFLHDDLESLNLNDDQFDLVIGNASLVNSARLESLLSEMVRVTRPGGTVALALPTASSFAEFFSVYWEALHNTGLVDHERDVEDLILRLPTVSDVEELVVNQGVDNVESITQLEEFDFESGEDFLTAPLISEFLMKSWLASLPESWKAKVEDEVVRIINEERHDAEFALTVKATLILGRKARGN